MTTVREAHDQGIAAFTTEAERDAYSAGFQHGHGIACHNVPTLGETVWTEDMGRVVVTAENIREIHLSECYAAENNSRSFSPFEFIAHDLNESQDSEALWTAFEQGVSDAILHDLSGYTDEDYGSNK
jgi:hypothetical protein